MLSAMTKAEIAALAKKGALGDPAAAAFWLRLREIAPQLAILNERNEKLDKQAQRLDTDAAVTWHRK
jgi:hypothetical protein